MSNERFPLTRFARGQPQPGATRLNNIVDGINELAAFTGFSEVDEGEVRAPSLVMYEIKTLDHANRKLTCVLPGEGANVNAFEYEVGLPQFMTETSRGAVTYVYSGTDINNRTASGAAGPNEDQWITPEFVVGELVPVLNRLTGALVFAGDGRMWAIDPP